MAVITHSYQYTLEARHRDKTRSLHRTAKPWSPVGTAHPSDTNATSDTGRVVPSWPFQLNGGETCGR